MNQAKHLAATLLLVLSASACAADGEMGEEPDTYGGEVGKADGEDASPAADPFAEARDVNLHLVHIAADLAAPEYDYPEAEGFYLSGTEFWQKWSGGHNPTYSYSEGTEKGRKCMLASAIRFEAIMADPPAALVTLRDTSNWDGSFFNWNDDYSESSSNGSRARLWAWRTHLIKWISQTNQDGSCYLPTRELVERAAQDCIDTAAGAEGEIQGCAAYGQ